MAKKNVTITVTVIGWEKHNGKKKRGHLYLMLSSRFFDDPQVQKMTPSLAVGYLYVLTRCADQCSKTVVLSLDHWRKNALSPREDSMKAAKRLESLRLLTIDSVDDSYIQGKALQGIARKDRARISGQVENGAQQQEMPIGAVAPPPAVAGLHALIQIWNSNSGSLPKVKNSNPARERLIAQRWKEQAPEAWTETVKKMAASNFCQGKNNTGWRADFDFLLQPHSWLKVNEGKYDNSRSAISTNKSRTYDKLDELERKFVNGEDVAP